jgi:hypothetical protein
MRTTIDEKKVVWGQMMKKLLEGAKLLCRDMSDPNFKYYSHLEKLQKKQCTSLLAQATRTMFVGDRKEAPTSGAFYEFYEKLKDVILNVNDEDILSIMKDPLNRQTHTEQAQKLFECFDILENNGFYNANGCPIAFWSGAHAHAHAKTNLHELTAEFIPSIKMLMKFAIQLYEEGEKGNVAAKELAVTLMKCTSVVLASQARGHIVVYLATHSKGEVPTLISGNFHDFELGALQMLFKSGEIKTLSVSYLDYSKNTFSIPIPMNSEEARLFGMKVLNGSGKTKLKVADISYAVAKFRGRVSPSPFSPTEQASSPPPVFLRSSPSFLDKQAASAAARLTKEAAEKDKEIMSPPNGKPPRL